MKITIILATAITLSTLAACSNSQSTAKEETAPVEEVPQTSTENNTNASATALPSFSVQDINGQQVNLQSFKGKKVFVNLWASWCPPCRREMPSIQKLYQSVDTDKVAFVLLSLDDHFDKAKKFISQQKLKLPIYYPAENLPELFNVQGIPSTFIFDESGKLVKRIDGGADYDSDEYRTLLN